MVRHKPLQLQKTETSKPWFNARQLFYLFILTLSFLFAMTSLSILFAPTQDLDDPAFFHAPTIYSPLEKNSDFNHHLENFSDSLKDNNM